VTRHRFLLLAIATTGLISGCGLATDAPTGPAGGSRASLTNAEEAWELTDLGTLGGPQSTALAINSLGQIVGYSSLANGERRAFLWENGVMTDLGTLGGTESVGRNLNNRGQVIGSSTLPNGDSHAFLWEKGVMSDLGTLGGNGSSPIAINEQGQIVGSARTADSFSSFPFLWENGIMTALSGIPGQANAINDRGEIAGWVRETVAQPYSAVRWHEGKMTELGIQNGNPWGINSQGQIAGRVGAFLRGFLWQEGTVAVFGGLLGSDFVNVGGINNNGDMVGSSGQGSNRFAVLWKKGQLIPIAISATQSLAQDINNRGQIVGSFVTVDGETHAALWTKR
jgi:probable HAF family extracellular repeat protein